MEQLRRVCTIVSDTRMGLHNLRLSQSGNRKKSELWNELLDRFENVMQSLVLSISDKDRVGSILVTITERYLPKTNPSKTRRVVFNLESA